MSFDFITANTIENTDHYLLFKRGEERGLNYIYKHLYKSLYYYGLRITPDDFLVNTVIQEAFLRVWYLRERMTGMLHIFRFLRLIIRWECYAYFRTSFSRFNKRFTYLDYAENTISASFDLEIEEEYKIRSDKEAEQLKLIYDAIPYLPQTKQTIIKLYIDCGFNPKKIAARYGRSFQNINVEVAETIEFLKSMLVRSKLEPVNSKKEITYEKYLNEKQAEVYRLRKDMRYGFDRISIELNLSMEEVLNIYIESADLIRKSKVYEPRSIYNNQKNTAINK